jgi:FkbM family methyltransferase
MEHPLLQRGIHFLRKAGVRRFALKTAHWAQTSIRQRGAAYRDRRTDEELRARLLELHLDDGHVVIPVLDFVMKVRANDPGLSKELILDGVRERDAVEFLRPYLSRCKTIVEIGANQGYYLIQEGLHSPDDATIHAFEPHPHNVKTAALNMTLNGIVHKCRLAEAAISESSGKSRLVVSNRSNWHTLNPCAAESLDLADETIEVNTFSLDEYFATAGIVPVDLIRMDVEGHEFAVIRGAVQTIACSPNILIFLEFHTSLLRQSGESPERLLGELRDLGFKCLTVCGKGKHLRNPSWDDLINGLELITAVYGTHMFFARNNVSQDSIR